MLDTNKRDASTDSRNPDLRVFRAPGRVNLIGEHTDYNDGFVMPAAIGFSTTVSVTPRADRTISVFSENFRESFEFDLNDHNAKPLTHWGDYVRGVAIMLELAGNHLNGATLRVKGEVPIGSGLSSSAAIEVATALALLENSGLSLDRVELARICQRAEHEFVGMRCMPEEVRLVICNTMVKHALATGEYNARRAECELGVTYFGSVRPEVHALRDVTDVELEAAAEELPKLIYRRCRHVITENARVLETGKALERGDLDHFGQLMNESHRSLREDYEVSCAELDLMVQLAQGIRGVYGARMTGGGFGGCTISLVNAENIDEFKRTVAQDYAAATGIVPEIYVCSASAGAREVVLQTHPQQHDV